MIVNKKILIKRRINVTIDTSLIEDEISGGVEKEEDIIDACIEYIHENIGIIFDDISFSKGIKINK